MKRFVLGLLCASSLLLADEDMSSYSLWDFHPIHGGGNVIGLGSGKVTDTPQGGDLTFRKANAFLYMLLPINQKSYFFPRVEWNTFQFDWNKNPKFHATQFSYVQFALTFYTIAIEKWRWILRASYNLDQNHFNRASEYGLFEGFMWGAYQIHKKWHYHIGAFGYTGMRGEEVYPLIGADFSPNAKWTFLAIFPIDYSIQYKPNAQWRLSLKGRPLKERFRTGKQEPQPRSIFSYSSMGAEFNIHFEKFMRLEAEVFAGYNFGGSFYIKNKHNHQSLYANVGGTPYVGANLDIGF